MRAATAFLALAAGAAQAYTGHGGGRFVVSFCLASEHRAKPCQRHQCPLL